MDHLIDELIEKYREVLRYELGRSEMATSADLVVGYEKADALASADTTGKNSDIRKQKEADALANAAVYQEAVADARSERRYFEEAKIESEIMRQRIGLTKAWYYSQSGVGA